MTGQSRRYESIVKGIGAKRLSEIRKNTCLTLPEFAQSVGKTKSGYTNYLKGIRELPQSTRLAVMHRTGCDPLSTEDLRAAVQCMTGSEPGTGSLREKTWLSFPFELRAESRAFRENNYSRPARFLLSVRDHAYVTAVIYGFADLQARRLNMPSLLSQEIRDALLVTSFALIIMFIVPICSEFPVTKVVRHLTKR